MRVRHNFFFLGKTLQACLLLCEFGWLRKKEKKNNIKRVILISSLILFFSIAFQCDLRISCGGWFCYWLRKWVKYKNFIFFFFAIFTRRYVYISLYRMDICTMMTTFSTLFFPHCSNIIKKISSGKEWREN